MTHGAYTYGWRKQMSAGTRFINVTNGVDSAPARLGGNLIVPGSTVAAIDGDVTLTIPSTTKPFGAFQLSTFQLASVLTPTANNSAVDLTNEVIAGYTPVGPRINAVAGSFDITEEGYYTFDLNVVTNGAELIPLPVYRVGLFRGPVINQVTSPGVQTVNDGGAATLFSKTGLIYLSVGNYHTQVSCTGYAGTLPFLISGTLRIAALVL